MPESKSFQFHPIHHQTPPFQPMPEPNHFQFRSSTVKIPQFHPIHHHRRKPPPHFASITSLINDSKHHFTQFVSSINHFQLNTQNPPKLLNPNLKLSEPSKPPPVPVPFNPNLKNSEVSKPPSQVPSNQNLKNSEVSKPQLNLKNSEVSKPQLNLKSSEVSKPNLNNSEVSKPNLNNSEVSKPLPALCSASLSLTNADELTQSSKTDSVSHSVASIINDSKQSFTQFVYSINKFQQIIQKPPNLLNLKNSEESGELTQSSKSHLITSIINKFQQIIQKTTKLLNSNSSVLCSASLSLTEETGELVQSSKSQTQLTSRNDDERVLISEVLVRNKDGEELERKDLEEEAIAALKKCRSNSALTVREVQEDVHQIIGSGYFSSCMPVAVDTRDGIRLVFQVEPNQDFQGLICEGANALPTKFIEDKFRDGYGKIVNVRRLDEVINSINGWYMERGLFGLVSGVEILSGGILRLQVSEAEVNNISVRFLNKTGEPTTGKTRPETILRQLNTKKGQVYSMLQAKRDVDTLLAMGIMEDVSIIPQPAGDSGKVDFTINAVERVSGGISAGGGISSGITSGLAGLIGSCAVYHRNLFGRNQKVNLSLERGQIDSIFRINYTDPWIEGDDKRTSRTIMIQNSRTPGTLVHGPHGTQSNNSSPTITRITGGIEYSRPFRPKWSGTAGLIFQRAGARGERGQPMIKDSLNCPLTASGNNHDDMLLAKVESVYTGSSDPSSSLFVVTMEQGLPVWSEWLAFNRVTARARKGLVFGPARLNLSLSGGHVEGNFPPHEAFPIGGTNSVRGYEEGDIGSGRSYAVGCGEISFPMVGPVEGVMFADYGTDLGSGPTVLGDPAGARSKPGSGYGYGVGVRVASPLGPLRLEYAFSDQGKGRFHFGVGQRN